MISFEFEQDLLVAGFNNAIFLTQYSQRIRPEDFNNEVLGDLWRTLIGLRERYIAHPTMTALETELYDEWQQGLFAEEDFAIINPALDAMRQSRAMSGWTEDRLEMWIQQRAYERFGQETQAAISEGRPHDIHDAWTELRIKTAPPTGEDVDFIDRMDIVAARALAEKLNLISTGSDSVDTLLGGGYAPGDFGMLWGQDGIGKSFFLIQLGAAAMNQGYRVLHVNNEMLVQDVEERYVSYFNDIDLGELGKDEIQLQMIRDRQASFEHIRGKLDVRYVPAGSNPEVVQSMIELAHEEDDPYHVVFVDYIDRFESRTKIAQDWLALEKMFEQWSNICKLYPEKEQNPALWVITHTDASGFEKASPRRDSLGRSKAGKLKNVDFALVIGQSLELKAQNVVQITRMKDPRRRGVQNGEKKRACLLRTFLSTGKFYDLAWEEFVKEE